MNNRLRKKKQLRRYNFTKKDIYNASTTMAEFIYELLVDFKKMKRYGYDASSPEEWEQIIDELIWTFRQLKDDHKNSPLTLAILKGHSEVSSGTEPFGFERNDDGTLIFKPRFQEITNKYVTDEVKKEEEKYCARIKKGLELFARYFEGLWD